MYQGLLSRDSEVFRGLFAVPQPSSAEAVDGCPIVYLTDSSEQLRHLLRVVFDGKRYDLDYACERHRLTGSRRPFRYYRLDEQLDFAVVAALVRLSHKYQLDYVLSDFLARMMSCFGTDSGAWERVSRDHGSTAMRFSDTDAIAVVNIARLTGADSMLPTAFYLCCQLDPECVVGGRPQSGSDVESLSSEDVVKYVKARQSLLQRGLVDVVEIFDTVVPSHRDASAASACRSTIDSTRQNRLTRTTASLISLLSRTEQLTIRIKESQGLLCRSCADALCRVEQQQHKRNWRGLPQLLGLETTVNWPKEERPAWWPRPLV